MSDLVKTKEEFRVACAEIGARKKNLEEAKRLCASAEREFRAAEPKSAQLFYKLVSADNGVRDADWVLREAYLKGLQKLEELSEVDSDVIGGEAKELKEINVEIREVLRLRGEVMKKISIILHIIVSDDDENAKEQLSACLSELGGISKRYKETICHGQEIFDKHF